MSITPLSDTIAKRLSTAQVITSVFSVVKELVENAIDAGANNIEVNLEDKGLSFIEVRDNGKGIPKADAAFAALPSYTSKLKDISDLESLETYGFRGEALSAICRVADVKIITKTYQDDAGRCYTMQTNGNIQKADFCARQIGTTIVVETLFKYLPVRRKIISEKKHIQQDLAAVGTLLRDFGICRPDVRISYRVDNTTIFVKAPSVSIKDSLTNIFGRKITINLEFLQFESPNVRIDLIVPKKDVDEKTFTGLCQKDYCHIYTNYRPVVYPEFKSLIVKGFTSFFDDKIPARKKPIFFLNLKVPLSGIDANLEPNKTKVLLKNKLEILENVKNMLEDYYQLGEELISQVVAPENDTTPPENRSSFMESMETDEFDNSPVKPSKVSKKKVKVVEKKKSGHNGEIEENAANNEEFVDPGKDFNTKKNREKATLLPHEVQAELDEMTEVDKLISEFSESNNCVIPPENPLNCLKSTGNTSKTANSPTKLPKVKKNTRDILVKNLNSVENEDKENNQLSEKKQIQNPIITDEEPEETLSQMPKVDLGEDFSTQEIRMQPTLQPHEIQEVMDKMRQNDESKKTYTDEQWSKGHIPFLQGGIKVCVSSPSSLMYPKKTKESLHASSDPKNRGFVKFSLEIRPQLIKENPELNLVEIAKLVCERWKNLQPNEREEYRVLGLQDTSLNTSRYNVSQKRKTELSPQALESNKKKMLTIVENMRSQKAKDKKANVHLKTCIPWKVGMKSIREDLQTNRNTVISSNVVVGLVEEKICIVKTSGQLWSLNLNHMFESLNLDGREREEALKNRDMIQAYFKRFLRARDPTSSSGMFPIHEIDY